LHSRRSRFEQFSGGIKAEEKYSQIYRAEKQNAQPKLRVIENLWP